MIFDTNTAQALTLVLINLNTTLAEFYQQHDRKHTYSAIVIVDPSYAHCYLIVRQSIEFKQFLS